MWIQIHGQLSNVLNISLIVFAIMSYYANTNKLPRKIEWKHNDYDIFKRMDFE